MIVDQDRNTENLLQINKEIIEYYSDVNVNFDKSYFTKDGKNVWVDPSTTKKDFDQILRNILYTPRDIFIDCGSGLGHVLYLSSFHFEKIIGVEILNDVANASRKNLISLMGKEEYSKKIELIIGDVLEQSEVFFSRGNIFYISSPFDKEDDFRKLIDKIYKTVRIHDRKIYIIYYYPYFKSAFNDYKDCFKLVKELNLIGDVVIYKH